MAGKRTRTGSARKEADAVREAAEPGGPCSARVPARYTLAGFGQTPYLVEILAAITGTYTYGLVKARLLH